MKLCEFRLLHVCLDRHHKCGNPYWKWNPSGQGVTKAHGRWKSWCKYVVKEGFIPSGVIRFEMSKFCQNRV